MKNITAFISAFLLFLFLANGISASTLDSKQIDYDEKSWTVRFNSSVSTNANLQNSIYILDASGKKHPVTLKRAADGKSVVVDPQAPYYIGKSYRVVVSAGLLSQNGKELKQPTTLPFSIKGNYIYAAQAALNPLVTNVTVEGSASVGRITAAVAGMQETTLHRGLNNRFSHGMIGLLSGDILTIRAYSSTGQLLEQYLYEVTN